MFLIYKTPVFHTLHPIEYLNNIIDSVSDLEGRFGSEITTIVEQLSWLKENNIEYKIVTEEYTPNNPFEMVRIYGEIAVHYYKYYLTFENNRNAMLFKLRWL